MQEIEEKTLYDLIPGSWFVDRSSSAVFVAVFETHPQDPEFIKQEPWVLSTSEYLAAVVYGAVKKHGSKFRGFGPTGPHFENYVEEFESSPKLFLVLPARVDGIEILESEIRERLAFVTGLLTAIFKKNIAYRKIHEFIFHFGTTSESIFSEVAENPYFTPFPILNANTRELANAFLRAVNALEPVEKARVGLSLRWFEESVRSMNGVDTFLKFWIALETLMMDSSDIAPINRALVSIYSEVSQLPVGSFLIGKLFGLRSRIVHSGLSNAIHGDLHAYCNELFYDLLAFKLGMARPLAAQRFLELKRESVESILKGLLRT